MSEGGPVQGGVLDHQAGNACGGGGGEQGVKKRGAARGPGGKGEHEKQGPRQDQQEKTQNDDLRGCDPLVFPKSHGYASVEVAGKPKSCIYHNTMTGMRLQSENLSNDHS